MSPLKVEIFKLKIPYEREKISPSAVRVSSKLIIPAMRGTLINGQKIKFGFFKLELFSFTSQKSSSYRGIIKNILSLAIIIFFL